MCPDMRCSPATTSAIFLYFTKQYRSQERFDQLLWNFARHCIIPRGVLKNIFNLFCFYFKNGGHVATCLQTFLENSKTMAR